MTSTDDPQLETHIRRFQVFAVLVWVLPILLSLKAGFEVQRNTGWNHYWAASRFGPVMLFDPPIWCSWIAIVAFDLLFLASLVWAVRNRSLFGLLLINILTIAWFAVGLLVYLMGFEHVS